MSIYIAKDVSACQGYLSASLKVAYSSYCDSAMLYNWHKRVWELCLSPWSMTSGRVTHANTSCACYGSPADSLV